MNNPRETVRIDVRPFICGDCGNVQFMADMLSLLEPGNCANCEGPNIFRAGPARGVEIALYKSAVEAFAKGEK